MYISLYDLAMFILFMIIASVGAYLIAVLRRVFCVLGQVREIFNTNKEDIQETLYLLPKSLANINEIAVILRKTIDQTNNAFDFLENNMINTVDDLRDGLQTFAVYAKVFGEIFRAVFSKGA